MKTFLELSFSPKNGQNWIRPDKGKNKFCEALRQVKNQHFKVKFWDWDPITIWH